MEQHINYSGTLRIRNPKTLEKWVQKGWFQEELNKGYTFAFGCGRFIIGKCKCTKCKKEKNSPLRKIINSIIP